MTVDRRTVAKGAAWTIPAIAIAPAAPSLAASPPAGDCPWALEVWKSHQRQPVNNNVDEVSFTVRVQPNNFQPACRDTNERRNEPYPYQITATITLDNKIYKGPLTLTRQITLGAPGSSQQINLRLGTTQISGGQKVPDGSVHVSILGMPEAVYTAGEHGTTGTVSI